MSSVEPRSRWPLRPLSELCVCSFHSVHICRLRPLTELCVRFSRPAVHTTAADQVLLVRAQQPAGGAHQVSPALSLVPPCTITHQCRSLSSLPAPHDVSPAPTPLPVTLSAHHHTPVSPLLFPTFVSPSSYPMCHPPPLHPPSPPGSPLRRLSPLRRFCTGFTAAQWAAWLRAHIADPRWWCDDCQPIYYLR